MNKLEIKLNPTEEDVKRAETYMETYLHFFDGENEACAHAETCKLVQNEKNKRTSWIWRLKMRMFNQFINTNEILLCDPKHCMKLNMESVKRYDSSKKRGKTKATDEIIEKFRKAKGKVIENGQYMRLSVLDIPGLPVAVREYPESRIGQKPRVFYDLGTCWSGTMEDDCISAFWHGLSDPEDFSSVIEFAEQHGVSGAKQETLKYQINALRHGYKVLQRISPEWVVFSPIIENGIQLRFYRDSESKSYLS